MTRVSKTEKILANAMDRRGVEYKKQKEIGPYTVDFLVPPHVIVEVDGGSPAGEAGFKPGDIILELDQSPVKTRADFLEKINHYHKADTILFLIKRGESTLYVTLKVEN